MSDKKDVVFTAPTNGVYAVSTTVTPGDVITVSGNDIVTVNGSTGAITTSAIGWGDWTFDGTNETITIDNDEYHIRWCVENGIGKGDVIQRYGVKKYKAHGGTLTALEEALYGVKNE